MSDVACPIKRGLTRAEAAGYIGIGTTLFDKVILAGKMPQPKRFGIKKIWDRLQLDVAFEAMSTDKDDADSNDWD